MNKEKFLKEWDKLKTKKIEEMPDKVLRDIIKKVMKVDLSTIKSIPYEGKIDQEVTYKYPELTAACPMTGIQDLYVVRIIFIPNKYIPELKSLKFYFMDFTGLPISHEHLQAKIYKDFKKVIQPKSLRVELIVAVRGGIYTTIIY